MSKITLLTLLRILVKKEVITEKEANDISCVEQVSDILKTKGVCDDTDFTTITDHYKQIIASCRTAVASSEGKKRKHGIEKIKDILKKEKSFV